MGICKKSGTQNNCVVMREAMRQHRRQRIGGLGGVLSPPMGSRGEAPGKFLDFTIAKRQENAFLGRLVHELTDYLCTSP